MSSATNPGHGRIIFTEDLVVDWQFQDLGQTLIHSPQTKGKIIVNDKGSSAIDAFKGEFACNFEDHIDVPCRQGGDIGASKIAKDGWLRIVEVKSLDCSNQFVWVDFACDHTDEKLLLLVDDYINHEVLSEESW